MSSHFLDIFSVSSIILFAVVWLVRMFFKMRKNKCVTMCSGCSGGACSTKSFAKKSVTGRQTIPINTTK